jgi:hypothetical protein
MSFSFAVINCHLRLTHRRNFSEGGRVLFSLHLMTINDHLMTINDI